MCKTYKQVCKNEYLVLMLFSSYSTLLHPILPDFQRIWGYSINNIVSNAYFNYRYKYKYLRIHLGFSQEKESDTWSISLLIGKLHCYELNVSKLGVFIKFKISPTTAPGHNFKSTELNSSRLIRAVHSKAKLVYY